VTRVGSGAKALTLAARPKIRYLRVYASPLLELEECVAILKKSQKLFPGNILIEFQIKYESKIWTLGSFMRKDDTRFQLHWMMSYQLSSVRASAHWGPHPNFFLRFTCGVGYFVNERGFSVESSLQRILSKFLFEIFANETIRQ